jgi:hypothetical protein
VLLAAAAVGLIGALVEILLLRRIYRAPELFPLLATFGVVLIVGQLVIILWGPEDLIGPRAPGLAGAIDVFGQPYPTYELFLIAFGPCVLGALHLLFRHTRWGILVRAATQDREMVAALGVNQAWLFTSVFALGAFFSHAAHAQGAPGRGRPGGARSGCRPVCAAPRTKRTGSPHETSLPGNADGSGARGPQRSWRIARAGPAARRLPRPRTAGVLEPLAFERRAAQRWRATNEGAREC